MSILVEKTSYILTLHDILIKYRKLGFNRIELFEYICREMNFDIKKIDKNTIILFNNIIIKDGDNGGFIDDP